MKKILIVQKHVVIVFSVGSSNVFYNLHFLLYAIPVSDGKDPVPL